MFKKEEIKEYLKNLKLDSKNYILYAGGSLTMQGIKGQTEDIDLFVNNDGLEELKNNYNVTKSKKVYPNLYDVNDELEVKHIEEGLDKIDTIEVEGVRCTSLLYEYNWKKEKNKPKDQEMIKKLEEIIYG